MLTLRLKSISCKNSGEWMVLNWLPCLLLLALFALCLACPGNAHAATSTGMAWETPLAQIKDSIKGPVAFTISLLGLIGAGATLIWGGEINEFVRKLVFLVLIISLMAFATSIMSNLFGISGALVS